MSISEDELTSPNPPRRTTMQDIADAAGVHVMTVSNALGEVRSVAPATRERVRRIARELNYVPNAAARALAKGKTGLIAVMSGTLNEPYYANMFHLLEQHMNAEYYKPVLLRKPNDVQEIITTTGTTSVDGAIAIDMIELVEKYLVYSVVPCVAIGTYSRWFVDSVTVDLGAAVEKSLRLMLEAGRRSIAYLATVGYMADDEIRALTYIDVMAKAGRIPRVINVETGVFDEVGPRLKLDIQKNGCPDALLCQNDDTAMAAYRALRDLGYRIPQDVLLVGCDGQPHMKCFDPPLSTIVQPIEQVCAQAWQFLRRRMADPTLPIQHAVFPGELLMRQSLNAQNETAPPKL